MEKNQLAFFAGTARKKSPDNSQGTLNKPFGLQQRKASARPKIVKNETQDTAGGAKGNWKKLLAFSKFMSLAKSQSTEGPAQLIIAGR
jgi:hypothetical protein